MFDGIHFNHRIVRSSFDQAKTFMAWTAPGAEDAGEYMKIRHTAFLLKMVCLGEMRKACGSGVEH
jgi:hypothetical protein